MNKQDILISFGTKDNFSRFTHLQQILFRLWKDKEDGDAIPVKTNIFQRSKTPPDLVASVLARKFDAGLSTDDATIVRNTLSRNGMSEDELNYLLTPGGYAPSVEIMPVVEQILPPVAVQPEQAVQEEQPARRGRKKQTVAEPEEAVSQPVTLSEIKFSLGTLDGASAEMQKQLNNLTLAVAKIEKQNTIHNARTSALLVQMANALLGLSLNTIEDVDKSVPLAQ